jgi:hypothetical protein
VIATCPQQQFASTRTFDSTWPEELYYSSNPVSGPSVTHRTLLLISRQMSREIGSRDIARLAALISCNQALNPECRWSMVNGSEYHHSRCQQRTFPNPEPRGADLPTRRHLDSTHFRGPARPRHLTIRVIGNRGIAISTVANPLHWETPNAEIPILRIRATCPSDNRRLLRNREIATRDFDVHVTCLVKHRTPIPDGVDSCLLR